MPGFPSPHDQKGQETMSLVDYYRRRASECDRVYDKPERQADIAELKRRLPQLLAGRRILDIAAGTGYWTAELARTAGHITAVDINEATLAVARHRTYGCEVSFAVGDAYRLDRVLGEVDAAFVGFFWSHVPRPALPEFVGGLVKRLPPRAPVIIVDNREVPGSTHPIARTDGDGNTYQRRTLSDGSAHEVLKNFPTAGEISAVAATAGCSARVEMLDYYWLAHLRSPDRPRDHPGEDE